MAMRDKTSIALSRSALTTLMAVRDLMAVSARRQPARATPALLKGSPGLGAVVEVLCERYFRDLKRHQRSQRKRQDERAKPVPEAPQPLAEPQTGFGLLGPF